MKNGEASFMIYKTGRGDRKIRNGEASGALECISEGRNTGAVTEGELFILINKGKKNYSIYGEGDSLCVHTESVLDVRKPASQKSQSSRKKWPDKSEEKREEPAGARQVEKKPKPRLGQHHQLHHILALEEKRKCPTIEGVHP